MQNITSHVSFTIFVIKKVLAIFVNICKLVHEIFQGHPTLNCYPYLSDYYQYIHDYDGGYFYFWEFEKVVQGK